MSWVCILRLFFFFFWAHPRLCFLDETSIQCLRLKSRAGSFYGLEKRRSGFPLQSQALGHMAGHRRLWTILKCAVVPVAWVPHSMWQFCCWALEARSQLQSPGVGVWGDLRPGDLLSLISRNFSTYPRWIHIVVMLVSLSLEITIQGNYLVIFFFHLKFFFIPLLDVFVHINALIDLAVANRSEDFWVVSEARCLIFD